MRPDRLDRAGEQPDQDPGEERAAEQRDVDEEAVGDDRERAARPDERLVLEVARAEVGVQERRREVVEELPQHLRGAGDVLLQQLEEAEADRGDEDEREEEQREAPREIAREPCRHPQEASGGEAEELRSCRAGTRTPTTRARIWRAANYTTRQGRRPV